MVNTPNEILAILDDAVAHARGTIEGVCVRRTQRALHFSCVGGSDEARKSILSAKRAVADYLVGSYPHREFNHATVRGRRIWWWHLGNRPEGLRCGIDIVPTEDELTSICRGPVKGVNC